jgi:hypothetical protein
MKTAKAFFVKMQDDDGLCIDLFPSSCLWAEGPVYSLLFDGNHRFLAYEWEDVRPILEENGFSPTVLEVYDVDEDDWSCEPLRAELWPFE